MEVPMLRRKNRRRSEPGRPLLPSIDWRPIAVGLAAMAVIAGAYQFGGWLLNRPVEKVVINGQFQRVSAIQLEGLVEPAAGRGGAVEKRIVEQEEVAVTAGSDVDLDPGNPSTNGGLDSRKRVLGDIVEAMEASMSHDIHEGNVTLD